MLEPGNIIVSPWSLGRCFGWLVTTNPATQPWREDGTMASWLTVWAPNWRPGADRFPELFVPLPRSRPFFRTENKAPWWVRAGDAAVRLADVGSVCSLHSLATQPDDGEVTELLVLSWVLPGTWPQSPNSPRGSGHFWDRVASQALTRRASDLQRNGPSAVLAIAAVMHMWTGLNCGSAA